MASTKSNTKSGQAEAQKTTMSAFAIPLTAEKVAQLREITSLASVPHLRAQFTRRANAVGYIREYMHLQPFPDGTTLLIVNLEFRGTFEELQSRLEKYKSEDGFDDWWTSKWIPITQFPGADGASLGLPKIERLFKWTEDEEKST
ncbi:hypothetical protein ACHAQA_004993 [Verticillium albo-atrum]